MKLPDSCQFWLEAKDGTQVQCGRVPVVADYFSVNDVTGERLLTSNCSLHDGPRVRAYAMAKNIERRSRKPELEAA